MEFDIESLRQMEISFNRRWRRISTTSSYRRHKTLPAIPAGSAIFEQVLREMRSEANKDKGKTADTTQRFIARESKFPDSADGIEEPISNETYNSDKNSDMYLSCNRYPWVCVTTKCVRQSWKGSDMKWNSIKAVANANADLEPDDIDIAVDGTDDVNEVEVDDV